VFTNLKKNELFAYIFPKKTVCLCKLDLLRNVDSINFINSILPIKKDLYVYISSPHIHSEAYFLVVF